VRKLDPPPRGTVHRLPHRSDVLVGNRPGDPVARDVLCWTPPGWSGERLPLLVDLVGYMGSGASHTNWRAFGFSLPERLDRLVARGAMAPAVVAMPDCFTRWGGNQYVNSHGTGRYMDYVCDEIVPFVEAHFGCDGRRAVLGKSSGGYGAMVHAMLRGDCWHAAACHSGDAYFEYCYFSDFPRLLNQLRLHGGSLEQFLAAAEAKEKLSTDEGFALMSIGMAAHYDGDPGAPLGFQLPVEPKNGAVRWDRWQNWLQHDPVRMIPRHIEALRSLRGLWIDCGTKDQFHLLWGARQMHEALVAGGVTHTYEEFDDDHSDVDYRMERSLPFLRASLDRP
jgi:S-formylglutathione hydrolase FrmB